MDDILIATMVKLLVQNRVWKYGCPNLHQSCNGSARRRFCMSFTLHGVLVVFSLWVIYPTSLRKMLLWDVLTSTFGGICEDFENWFDDDNVI